MFTQNVLTQNVLTQTLAMVNQDRTRPPCSVTRRAGHWALRVGTGVDTGHCGWALRLGTVHYAGH